MILVAERSKRVRKLVGNDVWFERGSPSMVDDTRNAVLAHWSLSSRVTRSVCTLVQELQSAGYRTVVCSACEASEELKWDVEVVDVEQLVVIRKPNVGYDFGSWSIALGVISSLAASDRMLIVNDSMAGPFISLRPLLQEFEATSADVWALTDSAQFGYHLQSYFLGFRGGVLADLPLRAFWSNIRHESEKLRIIFRNEIGLSRLLFEEGYVLMPAFAHESLVAPGHNPVIAGWKSLLHRGFPFVKREILRTPSVAPEGGSAPSEIRRLLDVDVMDWVRDEPEVGRIQP
jgi:lipopolysaccharide biosynthesis protein